jgi:hypothetical protein
MRSCVSGARKGLVAVVLAIVIGSEVYQWHENFRLRNQIETLQQEQEALAQRNEALQNEHAMATNRLPSTDIAQVQTAELLRLRGEVSRLNRIIQEQPKAVFGKKRNAIESEAVQPAVSPEEEQVKFLADFTEAVKTKNSVADIDRLKDNLARWDELSTNMFTAKMATVVPILKQRVIDRVAELEIEAAKSERPAN